MNQKLAALSVHLFTAAGVVLAFWSLLFILQNEVQHSLIVMALAVIVDSLDGTLARKAEVSTHLPHIDGALMDNITDYLNWVFIPMFWAYTFLDLHFFVCSVVLIASLFGFSNTQAKTDDHFFRGFPSYWNFVILYLYVLGAETAISAFIMIFLAVMVLVPLKFIYPSRTQNWRKTTILLSVPYACMIFFMLIYLQETPLWITLTSFYYPVYYVIISYVASKKEVV